MNLGIYIYSSGIYGKIMNNWIVHVLSFTLCINSTFAAPKLIDKIAAIVDKDIILESDINKLLDSIKCNKNQQLPDDVILHQQVLDQLIMDKMILQLAQQTNIIIDDNQLDHTISNIAVQHNITIDQLYSHLDHDGIDYKTYRAQIRKEMLITKLCNSEVRRRISILPQEVDSLAKLISSKTNNDIEFNLSYVLIPLPKNPYQSQVDQAKELAEFIVKQSKNGTNFDMITIIYSFDSKSLEGSQIGWVKRKDLPTLFTQYLHNNVHHGDIIGPIRSNHGFYVIKINEIRNIDQKVIVTEAHIRHILLRTSLTMTDQQVRDKLLEIAQQIKSGRISFIDAAKQISEDLDSAHHGGDLGWHYTEYFHPVFRDALMFLKKGDISEPIRSYDGWHLIQIIDTRQVDRTNLVQKDHAYHLLFNRKFSEEAQIWMQEQLASTYIKVFNHHNHG